METQNGESTIQSLTEAFLESIKLNANVFCQDIHEYESEKISKKLQEQVELQEQEIKLNRVPCDNEKEVNMENFMNMTKELENAREELRCTKEKFSEKEIQYGEMIIREKQMGGELEEKMTKNEEEWRKKLNSAKKENMAIQLQSQILQLDLDRERSRNIGAEKSKNLTLDEMAEMKSVLDREKEQYKSEYKAVCEKNKALQEEIDQMRKNYASHDNARKGDGVQAENERNRLQNIIDDLHKEKMAMGEELAAAKLELQDESGKCDIVSHLDSVDNVLANELLEMERIEHENMQKERDKLEITLQSLRSQLESEKAKHRKEVDQMDNQLELMIRKVSATCELEQKCQTLEEEHSNEKKKRIVLEQRMQHMLKKLLRDT